MGNYKNELIEETWDLRRRFRKAREVELEAKKAWREAEAERIRLGMALDEVLDQGAEGKTERGLLDAVAAKQQEREAEETADERQRGVSSVSMTWKGNTTEIKAPESKPRRSKAKLDGADGADGRLWHVYTRSAHSAKEPEKALGAVAATNRAAAYSAALKRWPEIMASEILVSDKPLYCYGDELKTPAEAPAEEADPYPKRYWPVSLSMGGEPIGVVQATDVEAAKSKAIKIWPQYPIHFIGAPSDDPPPAGSEEIEEALRTALYPDGIDPDWGQYRAEGMTDVDVARALRTIWPAGGSTYLPDAGCTVIAGAVPRLWMGAVPSGSNPKPDLSDSDLYAAVRTVLRISDYGDPGTGSRLVDNTASAKPRKGKGKAKAAKEVGA